MIPSHLLPGHSHWGVHLDELLSRPEYLWIYGPPGSGVTTLAVELSTRRGVAWVEASSATPMEAWLAGHPGGVVAAQLPPPGTLPCLGLRIPGLEEHPECIPALLAYLAEEESVPPPLPPALGLLPCPGNLRELRNRILRWKLLGQVPASDMGGPPPFEAEDMATNLHDLERYLLHRALRRAYGNRVEAATRLGVSRRQLYLLIARHGDPVRGESATQDPPQRVMKRRLSQNSSPKPSAR